jgi:UDP-4-amino-4,6-dideoxy-N-acetyl-beta-L-altrosamine transaminase
MTSDAARVLPYGRQAIDEDDIAAVAAVLRDDFLTTGPATTAFETALAERVGAPRAVSCANGTAALHLACLALGLGPGHSVIVPTITFAATANAARLVGAEIAFADVDPDSGLMGPRHLADAIARLARDGRRASAVFPVDLAGQCGDLPAIADLARANGMAIVEDSCHAIGASYRDRDGAWHPIGASHHAELTVFSFHPVKTITAGEGGAVVTRDDGLAARLALLRSHGIHRNQAEFVDAEAGFDHAAVNPWYYEMIELGLNYRLSDVNCALGLSQLKKLDRFVAARARLAARYDEGLEPLSDVVRPIARSPACRPAWHLYSVLIDFDRAGMSRGQLARALEERGIRTQVHYIPVHRHPYYRANAATPPLPGAEAYYRRTLSLPLFVGMTEADVDRVVDALRALLGIGGAKARRRRPAARFGAQRRR